MTSLYSEVDLPHKPSDHPDWQESWVLVFRDPITGATGFLRTGAYVNQGATQTHWGMALPDGTRFRRHLLDRKLEKGDRTETTASSGTAKFSIPDMKYCRFEAWDDDAEVDLRVYDWFPSQDWSFVGGGLPWQASRQHCRARAGNDGHVGPSRKRGAPRRPRALWQPRNRH